MVEKNPWWRNVSGPLPQWNGPIGCKEDGGGSHRGRGTVGNMLIHRAVNNHDKNSESTASAVFKLGVQKFSALSLHSRSCMFRHYGYITYVRSVLNQFIGPTQQRSWRWWRRG